MSDKVQMAFDAYVPAQAKIEADFYFGMCPVCHKSNGYTNIGRSHWFYCHEHKTRWCIGSNLFSSWKDETEAEQRAWYEANHFGSYENVKPYNGDAETRGLVDQLADRFGCTVEQLRQKIVEEREQFDAQCAGEPPF